MIVAKFIGTDGKNGFKNGQVYALKEPTTKNHEWKIMVENVYGAQWCSYNTVEAFLTHWKVLWYI